MKKLFAAGLCAGLIIPAAQAAEAEPYTVLNVAHLSCAQAWAQGGQSSEHRVAMIELLAGYLLTERRLRFPDDKASGQRFGRAIDRRCKSDPHQLLLSAVDASLREIVPR